MKKIHIIGLALVAMFAFSAIAASAAFASPEWLIDGNPVAAKTAVLSEGELLLCDDKGGVFGEKVCIHCSGKDKGTVGPGKADEVTEVTDLAGNADITSCTNDEGCGTAKLVEAENLPWPTELTSLTNDLVGDPNAAGKQPGYLVECEVFGAKITDLCEGHADVKVSNLEGGVDVLFEPNVDPATCTRGGAGQGLIEGLDFNFIVGKTLSVS
jgi:hypothetical protein